MLAPTRATAVSRPMTASYMVRGLSLAISLTFASASAHPSDGQALAWKYHCTTCHGERGVATSPQYPMLAGQSTQYLTARLRYFRAQTEPANLMNGQAAPLSDAEIDALARYFNGQR